ncbi:MAG TPA: hypothetical protein DCS05_04005 [Nitrospiraceae bacterium]|nr:hypothetical protein [Nitrospiraceae bacterium]
MAGTRKTGRMSKGQAKRLSKPISRFANGALDLLLDHVTERAATVNPRVHAREWSTEEDQFIRDNLGWLTDAEMGEQLGRTEVAVHLRWSRDLYLSGPSKSPDVITAHRAAEALGIDSHKTAHWVDVGLIPGRIMAGGRDIRLIQRTVFRRWSLNPMNWVYFDIKRVTDPELKRMLKKRAARWGDEWWSTRQVAEYHGVDTGDVKRYIVLGRLKSFRLPVSLGGRDHNRKWSNHFILKSDALQVKFYRGRGTQEGRISKFTPAADAWLLKARDELGMTFVHIGRTMKIGAEKVNKATGNATSNPTISYRYRYLTTLDGKKAKKQRR